MKVALVIHSQSGHTAQLARAMAQELQTRDSIEVDIHLLRPMGNIKPGSRSVTLRALPDISSCDVLLCGGPIWAFNASPVLRSFFQQLETPLKGKKGAVFVTHALPPVVAGKGRALRALAQDAELQGVTIIGQAAVYWGFGLSSERLKKAAREIVDAVADELF
jgi:flavodoxin